MFFILMSLFSFLVFCNSFFFFFLSMFVIMKIEIGIGLFLLFLVLFLLFFLFLFLFYLLKWCSFFSLDLEILFLCIVFCFLYVVKKMLGLYFSVYIICLEVWKMEDEFKLM